MLRSERRRRPGWGGGRASKSAANCSPCVRHRATRPCTPWTMKAGSTAGCSRRRAVETEDAGGGRGGTAGPLGEGEGEEEEGEDGDDDDGEAEAETRATVRGRIWSLEAVGLGESPGGSQKSAADWWRARGWADCCCCCCPWSWGAARLAAGGGTAAEQRPWPGGREWRVNCRLTSPC